MRTLLLITACLIGHHGFSQEIKAKKAETPEKKVVKTSKEGNRKVIEHDDGSKTISVSKKQPRKHYSSGTKSSNKPTTGSTTKPDYEGQIQSIKKKIEWVKSKPEEHKKALENGWYDKMNERIKQLEAKLEDSE